MRVERFFDILGADFYSGVPDSQLKALCDFLMDRYGVDPKHHIIAANEGNSCGIAAGYHLATGRVPVVYMQNSGEGNVINPLASLLSDKVYGIPVIFVVGWRGEPGVHDEPQHVYQGEVTLKLLDDMKVDHFVVDKSTSEAELAAKMSEFSGVLAAGRDVALVIKKGALTDSPSVDYKNLNELRREDIIDEITKVSGGDPLVCTTGKAGRELFEIRENAGEGHGKDFLTVGSMGHCSSIALGIAINKPDNKVWCIDGDGAFLMHMGAAAVIGASKPANFIHVLINNSSHETVGGMPTVCGSIDAVAVAKACGYPFAVSVDTMDGLREELLKAKAREGLSFIEVKCALGARSDLGRPTTTPSENKEAFMDHLRELR